MHEPQKQILPTNEEKEQGIDLQAAYEVLLRSFIRTQSATQDSEETDHV